MKTKIVAFLLAMLVLVSCFASCGGGKKGDGGQGNKPPVVPGGNETAYDWDTTKLIFQVNENSNGQELPSTSKRYLAGDTEGVQDVGVIDTMVTDRNAAAYAQTKVEVEYNCIPDGGSQGWGQNIDQIYADSQSNSTSRPDVFINFVYDMVATSLKMSLANLLTTNTSVTNYFDFADPEYGGDAVGDGYMDEYMRSLTLSKNKMYCLSSDYFTDMVRAFLIVPVNIGLLEKIEVADTAGQFNSDRDGDGDFDVDDFYALVTAGEWNYNTLAAFSAKVFEEGDGGVAGADLHDTLGFALSTDTGLSSSGMLYTTSITIIERELDYATGEYTYTYPGTSPIDDKGNFQFVSVHSELVDYCRNLTALFRSAGVVSVGLDTTGAATNDLLEEESSFKAIRTRFASGNILFGGVICLGSLEYDVYKDMNAAGKKGYGIVPVPLYRSVNPETGEPDPYLTQIHNLGRVGGISARTTKFSQCSAFLNYQSTHSTDILNQYYDYKLQYDVVGVNVKGNVEMLKYIRENVRSSFDKAFEDAIGRFYNATDPDSLENMWHTRIMHNGYTFTDAQMTALYNEVVAKKAQQLWKLENETYTVLPE